MKTKVITDQKMAKFLFNRGFKLINFKENRYAPSETVFVFELTDELLRTYNIHNRLNIREKESEE